MSMSMSMPMPMLMSMSMFIHAHSMSMSVSCFMHACQVSTCMCVIVAWPSSKYAHTDIQTSHNTAPTHMHRQAHVTHMHHCMHHCTHATPLAGGHELHPCIPPHLACIIFLSPLLHHSHLACTIPLPPLHHPLHPKTSEMPAACVSMSRSRPHTTGCTRPMNRIQHMDHTHQRS